MKLAFCLFNYFPYGGLQRDFLRIANLAAKHGHQIDVYTMSWQGERPNFLTIHLIPVKSLSNHQRCLSFIKALQIKLQSTHYDKIVGFNKMPGLDIYYAADGCFVTKPQYYWNLFKYLTRRYYVFKNLEKTVFTPQSKTKILLLSETEMCKYQAVYKPPKERLYLLPPGITKACIPPPNVNEIRTQIRSSLNISNEEFLLITIASSFHTKGIDRVIKSLKALPQVLQNKAKLMIVGQDNPKPYLKLATSIAEKILFLGARDDIPNLLFAADLLLHFARIDNTGTVILEALIAGTPVIATDICGYAPYINIAKAGIIIPSFKQLTANQALVKALNPNTIKEWHYHALAYSQQANVFTLVEQVIQLIENI